MRRAAWLACLCAGIVLLVYLRFTLDPLYRAAIFNEASSNQFGIALVVCAILALATLVLMAAAFVTCLVSQAFGS